MINNNSTILRLGYSYKALRIQDALGLTYQKANTYNQIGLLFLENGNTEKALEHYHSALKLFEKIGDVSGIASTNSNIGSALYETKKYSESTPYLEASVNYARKTEDPFLIGSNLVNLANLYFVQNRKKSLVENLVLEAIPYLKESESYTLSAAYQTLGFLFLNQKEYLKAKGWFEKALVSAEYFEDLEIQQKSLLGLSEIYEKQSNPNQALLFIKRHQAVKDSLINLESLETINNLNIPIRNRKERKRKPSPPKRPSGFFK